MSLPGKKRYAFSHFKMLLFFICSKIKINKKKKYRELLHEVAEIKQQGENAKQQGEEIKQEIKQQGDNVIVEVELAKQEMVSKVKKIK